MSLDEKEPRTGTPGNVPGEAETGCCAVFSWFRESGWDRRSGPLAKLPRESQASQRRDPCLLGGPLVRPVDLPFTLALSFSPLRNHTCGVLGRGEEADGTDQSPQSWAQVLTVILRAFPKLVFVCVCFFQRGEQAYLLLVAEGGKGRVPWHLVCRGEVGATEEAVGGAKPCSPLRRRL